MTVSSIHTRPGSGRRAPLATAALALALAALTGCGSDAPAAAPPNTADADTATYTLAQVEEHAEEGDCWAAVDGGVYDLSTWPDEHPGGAGRILDICGTDATDAFGAQHSSDAVAMERLAEFKVGSLQE